jgi:hypothetical protein
MRPRLRALALTKIQEKPVSLNEHLPAFSGAIGVWASVAAPHQFIMAGGMLAIPARNNF